MDNPSGNIESMNDMVFDEVNHPNGFNFYKWYDIHTLREVINYYKDELMTSS